MSLLRHDFQNDIGLILRTTDLVIMESKDKTTLAEMSNIEAVAERMIRLLSLLSSTSTQDSRGDIESMIENIASQAMQAHSNLQVTINVDETVKNTHYIGGKLLPLVFENLFRNSASYAGDNPIVTVTLFKDGDELIIDVMDNGPGVDPIIQEHLFEKGASTRGSKKGLGLYLSKKVILSLGGSIEYRTLSKGSAFRIRLKTF